MLLPILTYESDMDNARRLKSKLTALEVGYMRSACGLPGEKAGLMSEYSGKYGAEVDVTGSIKGNVLRNIWKEWRLER